MGSPKVTVKETDVSKSVQNPATGVVGYAGIFKRGAIFERIRISNKRQLVDTFGKPDDDTYGHFYTVEHFLNYGNAIDVVRVVNDDTASGIVRALCAGLVLEDATGSPSTDSAYIENYENYTATFAGTEELNIFAKDPGAWGNSLKIAIANYTDFATANILSGVSFASEFEIGPESSDEIAIAVIDNTESDNTIVEKFVVSLTSGSKDANGNNNYIEDKINGSSSYILAFLKSTATDIESFEAFSLGDGVNGDTPDDGDVTRGYNLYADVDNVDINYLIAGGNESDVIRKLVNTIAVARKDIMAFISPPYADIVGITSNSTIVTNLVADVTALAINSSYTAYFGNYMKIYDSYNDKYRWIPVDGEVVGLKVSVNTNNESWFAAGGFTRGILQNVQKLAFSPDQTQRDTLYNSRINPIYQDTGSGFVVLGQKTMLNSSSSFNRINVRELFIYIEKAIKIFSRDFLFEFNDATTRSLFTIATEQFMRDIVARRGVTDFRIVCNETNNTPQVLADNGFVADIAVKPNVIAEFITLNFFNVGAGVDFSEVV